MKSTLLFIGLFLSISVYAQTPPSYVPVNGLIGWWPFNGNADDESGNGNHGVVTNAVLTIDRDSNANAAYSFDGANGTKIQVANNSILHPSNYTVSAWVMVTGPTMWNQVLSKRIVASNTNSYCIYEVSNTNCKNCNIPYQAFDIVSNISGTQQKPYLSYTSIDSVLNNTWNMVTGTFDGTKLSYYQNGQLLRTINVPGNIVYSNDPLYFGTTSVATQNFNGSIDDIGIWDRELSPSEILDLYNAIDLSTNVSSIIKETPTTLYPNPSNLQLGVYNTYNKNIQLIDLSGRCYFSKSNCNSSEIIDVSSLSNGIYFIKVNEDVLKFVKE